MSRVSTQDVPKYIIPTKYIEKTYTLRFSTTKKSQRGAYLQPTRDKDRVNKVKPDHFKITYFTKFAACVNPANTKISKIYKIHGEDISSLRFPLVTIKFPFIKKHDNVLWAFLFITNIRGKGGSGVSFLDSIFTTFS